MGQYDLVIVFEVIPSDIEEVASLICGRLPRDSRHGDQTNGITNLLFRNTKVLRGFSNADTIAVHQIRHECEQEDQLVLRA